MTLIIAGERSGVGKTTITLALLSFLRSKNYSLQSFKVGPDYIDPMFHQAITGRPCRNLDPILTSESYLQSCFEYHCQNADYALIEGVMGLYDGVCLQNFPQHHGYQQKNLHDYGSTAHIAKILNLPVALVIDCSKISGSVAAIANGYSNLDPQVKIMGVILNKVGSDRHLELLKLALKPLKMKILGVLFRHQEIKIPDRHLGLIPTGEIEKLKVIFDQLANLAKQSFNWSQLLPYLQTEKKQPQLAKLGENQTKLSKKPITIGVAKDKAFNFYYQDNLDILENLGAEIVFWSPLSDSTLPKNIQGLYFGGGFPEIFARELSQNKKILNSVKKAIVAGVPTYAECGGLMYLSKSIQDFEGNISPMLGIIPTNTIMTQKLNLGYRQLITLQENCFTQKNTILWGHEFHRSQTSSFPDKPLLEIKSLYPQENFSYQGWKVYQIYASYLHLHFASCRSQIIRFLRHCCWRD
jgi:cobyrinic acid a,c-diamide synthase